MKSVALKAYPRSQVQRAEVTKLRAAGRVPATIYGRQAAPQNLEVISKEIADLLNHSVSENLLVDLTVEKDAPLQAPCARAGSPASSFERQSRAR